MSGLTGFDTGGVDLSYIFQSYNSGASLPTGYQVNGVDLASIFQPFNATNVYNPINWNTFVGNTGYNVNGADLCTIFAPYSFDTIFSTFPTNANQFNYNIRIVNGYAVITFVNMNNAGGSNVSANFKLNSNAAIFNVQAICIGGGGGGGNTNVYPSATTLYYGTGGSGGGIGFSVNPFILYGPFNFTYTVQCGIGGTSQNDGGPSYLSSNSTTYLYCTGGSGGAANNEAVYSGSNTINTFSSTSTNNGGNGGSWVTAGGNSTTVMSIPTALSGIISTQYGGGGSGGGPQSGGYSGLFGVGGAVNTTNSFAGQNATTFGSGGGGAGSPNNTTNYSGGSGYNGGFILYFPMNSVISNMPVAFTTTMPSSIQLIYPYLLLTYNANGGNPYSFTFTQSMTNVSVVCVAGGGMGANGDTSYFGTGGASAGSILYTLDAVDSNMSCNITVGAGGNQSAPNGETSTFTYLGSSTTTIICTGGTCGNINDNISVGGSYSINTGPYGLLVSCNGNGGNSEKAGQNSISGDTPFAIPPELSSTVPAAYGGGSACGQLLGGMASSNGIGSGALSNHPNGQNATTYGSGGGGGAQSQSPTSGGNGGDGVVFVFFSIA